MYANERIVLQVNKVFSPAVGNRDSDDLRQNSSALFPPEFYLNLLANTTIKAKIGATSIYSECPDAPFELFEKTGDVSDNKTSHETLWVNLRVAGRANMVTATICSGELPAQVAYLGGSFAQKSCLPFFFS